LIAREHIDHTRAAETGPQDDHARTLPDHRADPHRPLPQLVPAHGGQRLVGRARFVVAVGIMAGVVAWPPSTSRRSSPPPR